MNKVQMTYRFLALSVVLLIAVIARAGNTITLNSVSGHPGDETEVTVSLTNTDAVAAVQIDIPLNEYLTFVAGSAQLSSARSNGHTLSASNTNNVLSLIIFPSTLIALKGNSGELVRFKLKLGKEPSVYALKPEVVLSDMNGMALGCSVQNGYVTILAPKLDILTKEIDFGHIPMMGEYQQSILLKNVGTELLNISDIAVSDSSFEFAEKVFSINPGNKKDITITYKPTRRGAISETISIVSNSINGTEEAIVKADVFSVNEIHVQGTSGVCDEEVTINVLMNNMEPIIAAQMSFELPEELLFVEGSETLSVERRNGHNITSAIDGQKLTLYVYSGSLTALKGNNGLLASFRLKLNGTSGRYYIEPAEVVLGNTNAENMTSDVFGDYITIESPSISCQSEVNMGSFPVTGKATTTFCICNNGQTTLTIRNIAFQDKGYSIQNAMPFEVEPGSSEDVVLEYDGTSAGMFSTTMNIYSDDPERRMLPVVVSGELYAPNNLAVDGSNDGDDYLLRFTLNNYSPIVALQMDLHWDGGFSTSKDNVALSNRFSGMSYTVAKLDDSTHRLIFYSINNTPIPSGDGEIFTIKYKKDDAGKVFSGKITIDNIVMSNNSTENLASQTKQDYLLSDLGDINGDGVINVTDLTCMVNILLKKVSVDEHILSVADLNQDNKIDITDLAELVGMLRVK